MLKTMMPFVAAAAFAVATSAHAADLYEPPAVTPPTVIEKPVATGGWYLRGDLNYHWSKLRGSEYITYGCCGVVDPGSDDFDTTDLDGAFSLGAGVGYQMSPYLRADFTADYWFDSDFRGTTSGTCGGVPCTSTDESSYSALLLMANAYVDLGTYQGVTPYVGAGLGGAYVSWDDLTNAIDGGGSTVHRGASNWRFAWSVMAGASYCLTENLQLDAGYRFTQIEGGRMFDYANGVGPGFDHGFNVHEARAGLRYSFGNGNVNCAVPQVVAYEPPAYEYEPVYK
ncbi:outer membrane protein [Chelativorans intermedius]|uniref:Outer membrane protein n=1 Tax=Chelativorans intermedius TaxID=515947 RepID=A0ABV6DAL2_9HYPH|nr:outer membrane protein [Chelativorans intermedius]MCT8997946.1 porin family protein [Chelativorans intermedius]